MSRPEEEHTYLPKSMKQLKSTSQDIRKIFNNNIDVSHLAEKLMSCKRDDDTKRIKKYMDTMDFDIYGYKEGGVVVGYVKREELKDGRCGDFSIRFHPSDLVSESTTIINVLEILNHRDRVFVLEGNHVTGIVTRGDLRKTPVTMFLFSIVSLMEMHLLSIVRNNYSIGDVKELLKFNRIENAERLLAHRKKSNEAIDLLDCLQFSDKADLLLKTPELLEQFNFKSITKAKTFFHDSQKLRNNIAHGQDIFCNFTWEEVINISMAIDRFIVRCETIQP